MSNGFWDIINLVQSAINNEDEALKTKAFRNEEMDEPFAITEAKRRKLI